ncbi:BRISC and BRCA1-A complex member 2-like [Varroa jacobsoni]|uniref:BRISC and BRCA1-A complex member 2 n=1 Tax=Varroa destructor TaxID=109461 RepID=A0A7M7JRP3_VARDE|nr:BRISC and BRCA1-A complex member 2-like [Varroa destructor]XP_022656194.1 BRISC and BRCA1-A complex member 2-like [Varroa destructor]XP_022656205.1 BRISC and BRCA1-A complex member 2-like [Varroa destructor]XP_022656213.1 BRISC and BRCA1-A complex member 2-like [Varroa destructor]XP_022656222.1 BRISC and BRCA1-A complex member 2-like [Varroa destructor]XP_022656231.1 BRISC and BRCA1-A complex member 2-like [Varroa destructor]XP_022696335.1 BRISC and BRCA1-A complex member 2-like [Varroa ja
MRGDLHIDQDLYGLPVPLNERCRELANHRFFIHGREQQLVIESLTTGCGDLEAKTTKVDRFKLRWQHGNRGATSWWVILNSSKPEFAPDFIFNDGFLPQITKLPSLATWDVRRKNALVKVLEELISELILYELRQIPEGCRREYEHLLNSAYVDKRFCSASVPHGLSELADFWIRVYFDNDPVLFADLRCKLSGAMGRLCSLTLDMSPILKKALGQFGQDFSETSLERVVSKVYGEIAAGLEAEKRSMTHRREVLSAILTLQGDSLLEADIECFRHAHLLLKHGKVYIEVRIELPARFREGNDSIHVTAEDVYYMNCRCEKEVSVNSEAQINALEIAQIIMEETESITAATAHKVIELNSI